MNTLTAIAGLYHVCVLVDGKVEASEISTMVDCLAEYGGTPDQTAEAFGTAAAEFSECSGREEIEAFLGKCRAALAEQSDETKQAVMADIARIAIADGDIADGEMNYFAATAAALGVDISQFMTA